MRVFFKWNPFIIRQLIKYRQWIVCKYRDNTFLCKIEKQQYNTIACCSLDQILLNLAKCQFSKKADIQQQKMNLQFLNSALFFKETEILPVQGRWMKNQTDHETWFFTHMILSIQQNNKSSPWANKTTTTTKTAAFYWLVATCFINI